MIWGQHTRSHSLEGASNGEEKESTGVEVRACTDGGGFSYTLGWLCHRSAAAGQRPNPAAPSSSWDRQPSCGRQTPCCPSAVGRYFPLGADDAVTPGSDREETGETGAEVRRQAEATREEAHAHKKGKASSQGLNLYMRCVLWKSWLPLKSLLFGGSK